MFWFRDDPSRIVDYFDEEILSAFIGAVGLNEGDCALTRASGSGDLTFTTELGDSVVQVVNDATSAADWEATWEEALANVKDLGMILGFGNIICPHHAA